MKKFLLIFIVVFFSLGISEANELPNIKMQIGSNGTELIYPIRNNALVIILQPYPDNSGDFIFTVCNKHSNCSQTSMRSNEVRYIGAFLEDCGRSILSNLNKGVKEENWKEKQETFRNLYADYMNLYDKNYGELKSFNDLKMNTKGR